MTSFYKDILNLPSFLEGEEANSVQAIRLSALASNWVKLHKVFQLDQLTEEDVRMMMVLELRTNNRTDMLVRMKSHFNKLRLVRESRELMGVFTNGKNKV